MKTYKMNCKLFSLSLFRILIMILCLTSLLSSCSKKPVEKTVKKKHERTISFYDVTDVGANGFNRQKDVARAMVSFSDSVEPKFIISSGDLFHGTGIRSLNDPMWKSNYEDIYMEPSLHCDWYPVLGNHEYHGNTQAIIDYSKISRRWNMPSHYYTLVKRINDSTALRILFIDTPPFVKEYHKDSLEYPDICKQDANKQLKWIDSVLSISTEKWKIVVGHHPIFSYDNAHGPTPELIEKLDPVLRKYKVDAYLCGHIHTFQHLQTPDNPMEYIVTASGHKGRQSFTSDSTRFTSSDEGFTVCSVTRNNFSFRFVNYAGKTIYQFTKKKE